MIKKCDVEILLGGVHVKANAASGGKRMLETTKGPEMSDCVIKKCEVRILRENLAVQLQSLKKPSQSANPEQEKNNLPLQ